MTYSKKEIEEALAMLRNMQENCLAKSTDKYNDPLRDKKCKALNIAIESIKSTPKWISVEDKLPQEMVSVLGYFPINGSIRMVVYTGNYWSDFPYSYSKNGVTHWMPIPEKPDGY